MQSAITGGISRRTLLKVSAASGLLALSPFPSRALAQPSKGGHLVMAVDGGATGDSLDPRTFNAPYTSVLSGTVFNTLVEAYGETNELRPGLAQRWEPSDGGRRWAFDLVQGAEFHNGKSVTSEDVIHSLMIHVAEGSRSNSHSIISAVADIKADGASRVLIELSAPNYFFPAMLSNYSVAIVPAGTTQFDGIGTGAYKVQRFAPGEVLEAVRNENYFKSEAAHVESVELLSVNDAASRMSAIQSGQVNLATALDPRTAPLLAALPSLRLVFLKSSQFAGFNMRADTAPFDNPDLRLALKLAIDRDDIIRRVYGGYGRLGNDTPIPPNDPLFASGITQNSYDPERAAELYRRSGHQGPLVLQTSEAVGATAIDMAALFREHAAKAGITIDVKREPADGYWANIWAQAPFHATLWGARPTADMILSLAYSSASPANDSHWSNADFDAAIAEARAEEDEARRLALYSTAQEILSQDGGVIIPAFGDVIEGVSANIEGYVPGTLPMANLRAAEQVWFS
jgi:peptide/nickel transport system substrate-binding protein